MDPLVLYLTALLVGSLHTFEPDHLAAVSAFVVRRPRPREALGYGVRWAIGHGGVILLVGTAMVVLRIHVGEDAGLVLERVVGVSLVLLGGWVFLGARTLHAHEHVHADGTVHTHLHAHPARKPEPHANRSPEHAHRHAATAIGALHGLAGTAPAVALLPVARLDSPGPAVVYLLLFAVGTAASMGLYAMFAGVVAGRAAARSAALGRGVARFAGVGTVAVGLLWLFGGA